MTTGSLFCQWDGVTAGATGDGTRGGAVLLASIVLGWTAPASAQEPTVIWYRNSSGCPSAAAFEALVEERGRTARIATVGDRVDFVVTLSQGEDEATGRLERQTDDGIVAVREVTGDNCDEVASALAFTLGLADQHRAAERPEAPPQPAPTEPELEPTTPSSPSASPIQSVPADSPAPETTPDHAAAPSRFGEAWLDVSATGRSAAAPHGVWGGAVALSLEQIRIPLFLEAQLARGGHEVERGRFNLTLWAGRLEVCPIALERLVRVAWCGGLELGQLRARGMGADRVSSNGPWVAGAVQERLRWPADRSLALEGSLGWFIPFVAHRVVAKDPHALLHRVDAAGLMASLGVSFRLD